MAISQLQDHESLRHRRRQAERKARRWARTATACQLVEASVLADDLPDLPDDSPAELRRAYAALQEIETLVERTITQFCAASQLLLAGWRCHHQKLAAAAGEHTAEAERLLADLLELRRGLDHEVTEHTIQVELDRQPGSAFRRILAHAAQDERRRRRHLAAAAKPLRAHLARPPIAVADP
jgi:hypothetical protein